MRLHRLRLADVKGVAERTIEFPDAGVIVVEGPNEVGKTTMIEALDLLLDEKDSSRKRHVLAVRPVGRDVASCVEAELTSGPYRFNYRKQWFRQPATELTVLAPRREHLTGVEAHERVTQILAQTADLVLWRALRLMQATPLIQADLSGSSALAAALDAAAMSTVMADARSTTSCTGRPSNGTDSGALFPGQTSPEDAANPEADHIVAAAEAEYRRYFTAGQGQPTGAYRAARERMDAALCAAAEARTAVEEVQHDVDRHAAVSAETTFFDEELTAAKAAAQELESQWQAVEALVSAAEEAQRQLGTAQRDAQRAQDRWEERRSRGQALADGEVSLAEQAATAEELAHRSTPQEQELAALEAVQRQAATLVLRARWARDAAAAAEARRRDAADLAALEDRLRRLADLARDRTVALAEIESIQIDKDTLADIERAAAAVDIAVAALNAGSARITLTALRERQRLTVDGAKLTIAAGAPHERPVVEPLTVELAGQIRVQVDPEAGAHVRVEAVRAAREHLTQRLAASGADDLDQARKLVERREAAQSRRQRAEEVRADLLGSDQVDELTQRVALLGALLARTVPEEVAFAQTACDQTSDPTPDQTAPDQAAAAAMTPLAGRVAIDLADALLQEQTEEADELARQVHTRRETIVGLRLEVTKVASLVEAVRGQLEAERARLASSREIESDHALQVAAEQAGHDVEQANAARRTAAAELDAHDPATLRVRLDAAHAALPALRERRAALRDERIAIEARLAAAGGQGRQERLDAAERERLHATADFDAIDRRAGAARLLNDTLQRSRLEAKKAYVAPYARALVGFGRIVYGRDFDVEVADDLAISARILNGQRIAFEALSTGAKEQLAILTRLACATLVDPEHGVPVIIDDALGYSDPQRLRRICAAFSMSGTGAQLILLTCTPGRYAAIPGATVVRL